MSSRSPKLMLAAAVTIFVAVASGAVDDASVRVAEARGRDVDGVWTDAPFVVFALQALSATPLMPDMLPPCARVAAELDMVLTPGESEPVSFYVFATEPIGAFEIQAGEFKGSAGALPASCLDIKSVGCWPQAVGAWHSCIRLAPGCQLVPELLLNNAAVADSSVPVADTAKPVATAIQKGYGRQFFATLKAPSDAKTGIYVSELKLVAEGRTAGSLRLNVRVLPFTLPPPKTRYNIQKRYRVLIACAGGLTRLRGLDGVANIVFHQVGNTGQTKFENSDFGLYALLLTGEPDRRAASSRHAAGEEVVAFTAPYPGAENPERWRRAKGVLPYWADYDGALIPGVVDEQHPWLDPEDGARRSRSLLYDTGEGFIQTLAWVAVIEAVDDVRYFTLLSDLTGKAIASKRFETIHEGKKAAHWFELVDSESVDLDTLRLETIAWILKLQSVLDAENGKIR